MTLWEGARRLPYFFTQEAEMVWPVSEKTEVREFIFCPQCALEHQGDEKLKPHYTTIRSVMCCRCGILMGPINKAEMEEVQ